MRDLSELTESTRRTLWSRAAALLHAAALAALIRPEPIHAIVIFSGAAVLMGMWRRQSPMPDQPSAISHARDTAASQLEHVRQAMDTSEIIVNPVPRPAASSDERRSTWNASSQSRRTPPDASFDGMLAHLSHEMRTPLNALIGFADLMEAETFGPVGHPRYREYLGHIRSSGACLLQSAENTLAITELLAAGAPERTSLDLEALLLDARRSVPSSADRPHLIAELPACAVLGDRRVLSRALAALLTEAHVVSSASPAIAINAHQDADTVCLTISAPLNAPRTTHGASLHLALARTLFNALDIDLKEAVLHSEHGARWTCVVSLDSASQRDMPGFPHTEAHP